MMYEVMSNTGNKYYINVNQISWIRSDGVNRTRIAMTDGIEIVVTYDIMEFMRVICSMMGQVFDP